MKKVFYLLIALSFIVGITIGSSSNVIAQQTSIPSWVKNTALWWGKGQIGDGQFIEALQWLINQGIIKIPSTQSTPSQQSSNNSTPTSVVNTLTPLLPTSNDMGTLWTISPTALSSRFNIQSTPPIVPHYTIEQLFEKTTDTPPSIITIDIASFQLNGLSMAAVNQATFAYGQILNDYQNQNVGTYSKSSFTPTPTDTSESCYIYSISKTQSTKIDMFCTKGYTVFVIDATGNDLNMLDVVKSITNAMLLKIIGYH